MNRYTIDQIIQFIRLAKAYSRGLCSQEEFDQRATAIIGLSEADRDALLLAICNK